MRTDTDKGIFCLVASGEWRAAEVAAAADGEKWLEMAGSGHP